MFRNFALALLLLPLSLTAQNPFPGTPPAGAMYTSTDGILWNPAPEIGGGTQYVGQPPAFAAYCSVDGITWSPCSFSGGGGSGTVVNVAWGTNTVLGSLFTCTISSPTLSPVINCLLTNALQNSVWAGPASGGAGTPTYQTAPTISAANMTSFPTFNQNTTGTAANLSGTPALPNGTTATTQTTGDNTTKLATTAFVIANAGGTVTHTVSALTNLMCILGNGGADIKIDTACSSDGAGNWLLQSITLQGADNGSATFTFTGISATAPSTDQFQISPAVSITTPWSMSPAPAPSTGLYYGTASGAVVQNKFIPLTNPSGTKVQTSTGTLTTGNCPQFNASGDLVDSGSTNCGGGGGSVSITAPNSTLSLSPSPITGTGTIDINLSHANTWAAKQLFPGADFFAGGVDTQTGTSYAFVTTDENKLLTFNNSGATAVTLSQATTTGFTVGAIFSVFNIGAGTVTITPATSTINGASTLVLAQNQGAFIESDGTNYSAWVSQTGGGGITFPQTVAGTVPSGGLVYANSTTQISVAPLITAGQAVLSGGAGAAPTGQAIGTSGAVLVKANGANIWSATNQFSQTASGSTVTPFQLINSATTNTSCVEIPIFIEDAVSSLTQRSGFKDCQTSNTAGSPSDTVTIEQKNAGTLGNAAVISGPGNWSFQGTITSLIGQGTVSNTPGTGVTSVTCNTATCDVNGGTYTVVGGTFVTGTFVTLTWPTTTTAYRCTVNQNGGTTLLGLGHGVATATGMTVTNAVTVATTTFTFDYSCQP